MQRSLKGIDAWFEANRPINLRLSAYPWPTVAAINRHPYAGDPITALAVINASLKKRSSALVE
jgi:hypothetical protein